jgi:hypothetical protein
MSKHRKHHEARSSPPTDFENNRVWLDGECYHWERRDEHPRDQELLWARVSRKHCKKNGEEIPFKDAAYRRRHSKHDWEDLYRWLSGHDDHRLIRKLEQKIARDEKEQFERARKDALALDELRFPTRPASAASASEGHDGDASDEERKPAAVRQVKRTKHGVRVTSNDQKFYFNIAVFKSTKYRNCASVQLVVAGKWFNYIVDAANMKALREEVARGGN